ncbi:hypothetical protein GCM10029976_037640 [Kribbella albertanoniae]|uniref:DUF1707 domain-containing protein n=1 Tax=Kribbella albertanoniae TaxID=1266829 RepID=A0A4R4Q9D9_9ACTN|nr:DUF1707 domain-containing protein [Kribbella albertanoniae]TDC31898.1 DUF1707 domain-containing protein [Kribbella albertanoniae]
MNDEGPIRIGDAEREEAVRRLGEHYEAGRLSAEEHGERVEAALRAKTAAELGDVFVDLPSQRQESAQQQSAGPAGPPRGRGRRPEWAAKGPFGKIPLPVLMALGAIVLLAAVACTVAGGHPPVLLIAAIVAGVIVYRKRRMA